MYKIRLYGALLEGVRSKSAVSHCVKKCYYIVVFVNSTNAHRFLNFFYCKSWQLICNKIITKDVITP